MTSSLGIHISRFAQTEQNFAQLHNCTPVTFRSSEFCLDFESKFDYLSWDNITFPGRCLSNMEPPAMIRSFLLE